jgi:FdhD protein
MKAINKTRIVKFCDGKLSELDDFVAVEETLEIRLIFWQEEIITTKSISITMRTPGADVELALGFLFGEGIIKNYSEIEKTKSDENVVEIALKKGVKFNLKTIERHFYTSSSCGVCGKSATESVKLLISSQKNSSIFKVSSQIILILNQKAKEQQKLFNQTGGIHSSSLFNIQGEFCSLFEDVGRHNALDKLIGSEFIKNNLPLSQNILMLSGRISFELVQKAVFAGISFICAIGAPSSLAIQLAHEYNITLIGFLKKDSFNLYHGSERIFVV